MIRRTIINIPNMKELHHRNLWHHKKPKDKWKSDCPLCSEENLVLWEGKYWKIVHNKYPLLGLDKHLMLVPKEHVILTKDLSLEQWGEMKDAEAFFEEFYEGTNYFSFIRQSVASRSLEHLHYHYLPGQMKYNNLEEMLQQQWF